MELLEKMIEEMNRQKADLVKKKLIEKGYNDLVAYLENGIKSRFPRISVSVGADGYEYYFADNGTVQGDFIVAVSWKHDYNFGISTYHKMSAKSTLVWQDTNFDAVRIKETE